MSKIMIITFILMSQLMFFVSCDTTSSYKDRIGTVSGQVIYEEDDKEFISSYKMNSYPIFAMLTVDDLVAEDNNSITVRAKTMKERYHLCSDGEMESSLSISSCTGFMISKDLLITAGHCLTDGMYSCSDIYWYKYSSDLSKGLEGLKINNRNLVTCKEIIYPTSESSIDIIIMRVSEQKAENYIAINYDEPISIEEEQPVYVLGYPAGTALTVTDGNILSKSANSFLADVDTFVGNSGSPVFDKKTDRFIGVLTRGERDFIYNKERGCRELNYCKADDSCSGEQVLNKTVILSEIESYILEYIRHL